MSVSKTYYIDGKKIDPKDCLNIAISDFKLHARRFRNPKSFGRQYEKAMHGGKVRRAYSNTVKVDKKSLGLEIDLGEEKLFEMARKSGKKYVRFFYPKEGIPLVLADDFMEKLNALAKRFQKEYK